MCNRFDYIIDYHVDYVIDYVIVMVIVKKIFLSNRNRNCNHEAKFLRLHSQYTAKFKKKLKAFKFYKKIKIS